MLNWWRIVAAEVVIILLIMTALGYIKMPKFMRRKIIVPGFPWGYYRDKVPKTDPGFYSENSQDFLHDTGTRFSGMEGFGDYGEFTGFGEMGEFGAHFGSGESDYALCVTHFASLLVYLGAFIGVVAVASLFAPQALRARAGNVLLLLMTIFAAGFICTSYFDNNLGKTNGDVAADQAEMQLRMLTMTRSGLAYVNDKVGLPAPDKTDLAESDKAQQEVMDKTRDALTTAVSQNPKSTRLKAKLAIILALGKTQDRDERIAVLCNRIAHAPVSTNIPVPTKLAAVLSALCLHKPIAASALKQDRAMIEQAFGPGWFTEQSMRMLYKAAGANDLLAAYESDLTKRYAASFGRLVGLGLLIGACGLIGVITVAWQAVLHSRAPGTTKSKGDAVGLYLPCVNEEGTAAAPVSLKTIYAVFISWFALQILISLCFHQLLQQFSATGTHPLAVALTTAITYLFANLPGPFLIYFLALKPAGLNFFSALKLRRDTPTSPFKLIGAGVLGTCAMIPLVVTAIIIAHVQGSDNPVLGQIMQASTAESLPAILVFYFTLAVMAPFFEEILFRGFIYAGLKPHVGTAPALLISSVLFAVMHFDRGGILLLCVIGAVLAYVFERTRNLVPSMISHGLWNGGSFTLALLIFST